MNWARNDPAARGAQETRRAHAALVAYLVLGPTRSLQKLSTQAAYSLNTLKKWSLKYSWAERARRFDDLTAARISAEYEARRVAVMESGLALTHERVARLAARAEELDRLLDQDESIWLESWHNYHEGKTLVAYKTRKFNAPLYETWRALMADVAAEVGGRIRRAAISVPDGGPIRTASQPNNLAALSDAELEQLEQLLEKAEYGSEPDGSAR